jgi:ethanolamine ammonia-lyase small subunit
MKSDLPWFISSNGSLPDPWTSLQRFTAARIALGRSGVSIPLSESLGFRLAHAHARDAVYSSLDTTALQEGLHTFGLPMLSLHSQATSRQQYLQRPDLGRKLNEASREQVLAVRTQKKYDIAFILADGLSAMAVNTHAPALLTLVLPTLLADDYTLAPLSFVEHGRVAISDEIGSLLQARLVVILIGERPGLTSPDSMGIYSTYNPTVGLTDDARNCISNVRPAGLSYVAAVHKLRYLIQESLRLKLSGVAIKDLSESGDTLPGLTGI